jgi:hypothetical protein
VHVLALVCFRSSVLRTASVRLSVYSVSAQTWLFAPDGWNWKNSHPIHPARSSVCRVQCLETRGIDQNWRALLRISVICVKINKIWETMLRASIEDSTVGTATGYWPDSWGIRIQFPVGVRFSSSTLRLDRLRDPPRLSNVYREPFRQG